MRPPPDLVDPRPDTSTDALRAIGTGFVYCNVAGSGPTFPVAQRSAERARTWLNEVGMFSHVGYDAYNTWLAEARADPEIFSAERLGWRSQSAFNVDEGYTLQPDATRFETGTIDAPAFVGVRQALAVHRVLGPRVGERLRALRARLVDRLRDLPVTLRSRADAPTGIVVITLSGGDAAGIVTRMWSDDRVVVKHLAEKGIVDDGMRISFWALHRDEEIDRVASSLAMHMKVTA